MKEVISTKKVIKTYCGLNRKQLESVITTMSGLEDISDNLTDAERAAFDISLQCVTEIMNRMKDGKPIIFEEVAYGN